MVGRKMEEQFDFAFSFASEDRAIVEKIKNHMSGFNIFYDQSFERSLCGKDLYSHLRHIYKDCAKYVVCFLSKYYKQKIWTNLEFTAVKERFLSTFFASDFLIPIILDENGFLDDIPSFIGYHKYINENVTAELLKNKIQGALNEDLYYDNINSFRNYLLHEVELKLNAFSIKSICNAGKLHLSFNETEKTVFLYPESYVNLPCLLLTDKNKLPLAIITWKRTSTLLFTFSSFTNFRNTHDKLSFNDLINALTSYLLLDER